LTFPRSLWLASLSLATLWIAAGGIPVNAQAPAAKDKDKDKDVVTYKDHVLPILRKHPGTATIPTRRHPIST
jgi:cobalamin biosynthesis protein CbiG